MDDVKQVYSTPRLVCLEMSDEVPANLIAPDFRDLFFSFLHTVLAHVGCPKLDQVLHDVRRMGLADGNEPDLLGRAASLPGNVCKLGTDPCKSFCQWVFRGINVCHNRIDRQS
jgi:hypothetical protein